MALPGGALRAGLSANDSQTDGERRVVRSGTTYTTTYTMNARPLRRPTRSAPSPARTSSRPRRTGRSATWGSWSARATRSWAKRSRRWRGRAPAHWRWT